jgi:hypothetical protein
MKKVMLNAQSFKRCSEAHFLTANWKSRGQAHGMDRARNFEQGGPNEKIQIKLSSLLTR